MEHKKNPLFPVLIIYMSCCAFRFLEYFVLRTDQTFWGEAFVHKIIGIAILCTALKSFTLTFKDIGFTGDKGLINLLKGLAFGCLMFLPAYTAELLTGLSRGGFHGLRLYVSAYSPDGNIGNRTDAIFFMICIAGNMINVLMEEGIFRGLFQRLLQTKYSFALSSVIASCLFGFWHMAAPIRSYYDGASDFGGFAANLMILVITSGIIGFKFSLLAKMTGSLYMSMGDHFVNNTIVNVLHVVSEAGADELQFIRIAVAQTLSFTVVLILYLKRKKSSQKSDFSTNSIFF